ncbi:hypothetical protein GOP47_0025968 [Adiantum capillus-veneris]|uniref:Uncharacterized protein n=1 Tax=Adiantum capillus-veneris TaxID=13818 RepID=A0A9D4Z3D2_ADICA|nr:hypothetical protein GOP47_0025968 [Adiantum capillus-veneris]
MQELERGNELRMMATGQDRSAPAGCKTIGVVPRVTRDQLGRSAPSICRAVGGKISLYGGITCATNRARRDIVPACFPHWLSYINLLFSMLEFVSAKAHLSWGLGKVGLPCIVKNLRGHAQASRMGEEDADCLV